MSITSWARSLPGRALRGLRAHTAPTRQGLPPKLPRHVALIMDGNGRWAQKRGLPRSAGHAAGVEALRDIIRACDDWGIEVLSIYAFSTENWGRPQGEVNTLMDLLQRNLLGELEEMAGKNVRIRILGDVSGLPPAQRAAVETAVARTRDNTGLMFNIAVNYGGKDELLRAARLLMDRAAAGEMASFDLTEQAFAGCLYTSGQPDVDLLIRTSGEMRTSNFLPWQSAYAELVFNPMLWPDYDREAFREDLWTYAERDRRFGKVKKP